MPTESEFQRGSSIGSVNPFMFVGPTRKHEQDAVSSSNPIERETSGMDAPSQIGNFDESMSRKRLMSVPNAHH